jgi:hydroxyethylthiazole kinase
LLNNFNEFMVGKNMIDAAPVLEKVRREKPLVHHITNWVTVYDCANVVRMLGALPVMAHAIEESAEMQGISNALVLNIGTLTPKLVKSMVAAGKKANELGHPVVLDAVGVGATALRTEKATEILGAVHVDVLKGNRSEIAKLAGADVFTRGVEASDVEGDVADLAKGLAREKGNVVVVTGAHDIVASSGRNYLVKNGNALLGKFVGSGCMAASVIGCFAAVEKDFAKASAAALSCFGIAAEIAAGKASAPASFKQHFFDALYALDSKAVKRMQRIEELK